MPHSKRHITVSADFGQSMACPCYNCKQPGCTYYYTPLTINNFGVVDHSHVYPDGKMGNHMYCHVYHEGIVRKGATNAASLIVNTLQQMNVLHENYLAAELNIIMDNCKGQNKNNTVLKLKLAMWLKQMGYFKRVRIVFLIVGHTKNACDRLFNSLKKKYRQVNIFTVDQLIEVLRDSRKVTVSRTAASDFLDYDALFKVLYKDLAGLVLKYHIFDCTEDGTMIIRESDLDENGQKFNGAKATTPKDLNTLQARSKELLRVVAAPGINPYKQMELYQKYKSVVPIEYHSNELYVTPLEDVIKKVAAEKKMRNENRSRLKCFQEGGSEYAEHLVGVQFDADVKKMQM